MKKLYKKGTVHPTPPLISDHLSFLPAAIFTLTLSLSPDDREVLAYLLSCSSNNYANINNITNKKTKNHHDGTNNISSKGCYSNAPSFNCSCFRCYMSFWVRWDASPNRQLIHEIIDAFEDGLAHPIKKDKGKKERRRKGHRNNDAKGVLDSIELSPLKSDLNIVEEEFGKADSVVGGEGEAEEEEEELELEGGSIRRFVSFVGGKIWGAWN
ncbi:hypothetical protein LIER_23047 [Lithospermum erythrorhizon]|uniref:Uncharacterized protein n=1 Tax=Lithospermum erythrorhizon TaxID=34254 RepID=A0AAV3QZ29_LITER